jgi:hypothetical protein
MCLKNEPFLDAPLRPQRPQKPCTIGLFDEDARNQLDLLDLLRAAL